MPQKSEKKSPNIPDEAIVKPEDERPMKSQFTPEEVRDEEHAELDQLEREEDMDGDGSTAQVLWEVEPIFQMQN